MNQNKLKAFTEVLLGAVFKWAESADLDEAASPDDICAAFLESAEGGAFLKSDEVREILSAKTDAEDDDALGIEDEDDDIDLADLLSDEELGEGDDEEESEEEDAEESEGKPGKAKSTEGKKKGKKKPSVSALEVWSRSRG